MTDEQWEEYNQLWDEKQEEARRIAETFYSEELNELQTEYDQKLAEALDSVNLTLFEGGEEWGQMLIDGLSSRETELYAKASEISKNVSSQIRAAYSMTGDDPDGSHAGGLPYVPYDGYIAELHQGERVLTAEEAKEYVARSIPTRLDTPARNEIAAVGEMLAGAVNAVGVAASVTGSVYRVEIPIVVNGREVSRAIVPDLRSVMKSSPEVVSDW